uniref:CRISPR-associated protein Cas5 n=1 Tax=Desulforadius tongensis TaxID=1216062 RepID=UPI00308427B2
MLVFDLRGNLAHFRRPDTTGTHATYPFIPRTVLHGFIASVLGLEQLSGENWVGIQLLSPVRTCSQEMSMLGKGWLGESKSTFNRRTSIELVVNPHYRVYYAGDQVEKLSEMIYQGKSYYHTYLGSAYCLTFPRYIDCLKMKKINAEPGSILNCCTVVPSHVIDKLIPVGGSQYGRVGGMHYRHLGERRFEGTINIIYEATGRPVVFKVKNAAADKPVNFYRLGEEEVVSLW